MCKSLILQIKKEAKKGEVTCPRLFSQLGTESGQEFVCGSNLAFSGLAYVKIKKLC